MLPVQRQLHRLDPANKSMAIMGFSEDDLQKRSDCVHAMIAQYSNPVPVFMNLNTVFRGPPAWQSRADGRDTG